MDESGANFVQNFNESSQYLTKDLTKFFFVLNFQF